MNSSVGKLIVLTAPSVIPLVALARLAIAAVALCVVSAAWPKSDVNSKEERSVSDGFARHWPQPVNTPSGAPNIVLILLDDVGFGAASVFGGAVQTPGLEQLAAQGLRYNRFHVAAQCSPTRASLLSGRNPHRLGFGAVGESEFPGYNTIWSKEAVSIGEVLRRNGYSTAAVGKWHNTPMWEISPAGPFDRWPTGLGFEYFYGFMGAAENHWQPMYLYRNNTAVEASFRAGQRYHLTTDLADEAIGWIRTHEALTPRKPYFLYFATGATHRPNHVAKEWVDLYKGRFDAGWDRLREITFARQKELGAIPSDAALSARPKEIPAWNSLSVDERRLLAREMEVYAGFLTQTDHEVNRLIEAVKELPDGDNTLILYVVGDNGASSEAGIVGDARSTAGLLKRLDDMGGPHYPHPMNEYSSGWAWAMSTPFQWQKLIASHLGGTRSPLVVSWPARIKDNGSWRSQYTHVNDVAATLCEIIGIPFPHTVDGVKQLPLDGVSFARSFEDANAESLHTMQIYEQWGNRAIYKEGWLASARHFVPWDPARWGNRIYDGDKWELYRLDGDFSQAHDISARYPEKLKELQSLFDVEAARNNIYPLGGAKQLGDASVLQNAHYPTAGRREFIYHSGLPRLPSWMAPDFNQAHRITADIVISGEDTEGVIVANGSSFAGFAIYVKNKHLFYESMVGDQHTLQRSPEPLAPGRTSIAYEFDPENGNAGPGGGSGVGRLYVNATLVSETEARVASFAFLGVFGIGQAYLPMGSSFSPPFKFSGKLNTVKVELN